MMGWNIETKAITEFEIPRGFAKTYKAATVFKSRNELFGSIIACHKKTKSIECIQFSFFIVDVCP